MQELFQLKMVIDLLAEFRFLLVEKENTQCSELLVK